MEHFTATKLLPASCFALPIGSPALSSFAPVIPRYRPNLTSTHFEIHSSLVSVQEQVLDSLDAVVDGGGVYDPARDRFDHHQSGFQQVFGHGFTTKLSSAGVVYKELNLDVGGGTP